MTSRNLFKEPEIDRGEWTIGEECRPVALIESTQTFSLQDGAQCICTPSVAISDRLAISLYLETFLDHINGDEESTTTLHSVPLARRDQVERVSDLPDSLSYHPTAQVGQERRVLMVTEGL
eukprot:scaffold769_cov178-Ochromonas_danica.AAC.8